MFRQRFLPALPLFVATLIFGGLFTLPADVSADVVLIYVHLGGDDDHVEHEIYDDQDNGEYIYVFYDEDGNITHTHLQKELTNPSPSGQSTGIGPAKDSIQAGMDAAKKIGGNPVQETNPLDTPIGRGLVEKGTVPGAEIDPWDHGAVLTEDIGFGGGGGGFDPNIPIGEQIGKMKQKGAGKDDDDDGDGSDKNETFYDISDIAPEIVDPPPEPINKDTKSTSGLWDVPVAKQATPKAMNSFVLMGSPAGANFARRGLGANNLPTAGFAKAGRGHAGVGNAGLGSVGPNNTALGNANSLGRGSHQGLTSAHSMGGLGATPAIRSIGGAATSLSAQLR